MHKVMRTFLSRLFRVIIEYPKFIIVGTVLPCLLLIIQLVMTPLNFSFLAMLPTDDPLLTNFERIAEEIAINNQIILLLEGESEEDLDLYLEKVSQELQRNEDVDYVVGQPKREWFEENIAWISSEDDFAELIQLGDYITDQKKLGDFQERLRSVEEENKLEGARILLLSLKTDPLDVNMQDVMIGESPFDRIEKQTNEVLEGSGIEGGFAGLAAAGVQDQQRSLLSISKLTPLSLILVLFLLRIVEPRFYRLLSMAIPMILSFIFSLGMTGILLGELNFIECFFGMMVFGLGVDFGLHLLVRMREEHQEDVSFETALERTIIGVGPAIIAGGVTTAGAFFIIGFADDPTARHLGISGGLGLISCLFLMLTLLPAIWVLQDRNSTQGKIKEFSVPFLPRLVHSATSKPKVWVGAFVLWVAFSILGIPRFHHETNLENVFNRDVPAVKVGEKINEYLKSNTTQWIFLTSDIEEDRVLSQKLKASNKFEKVLGISDIFPVPLAQREAELAQEKEQIEIQKNKLLTYSFGPPSFSIPARQILPLMNNIYESTQNPPPSLDTLPPEIQKQFLSRSKYLVTYAYGFGSDLDSAKFTEERLVAESIHPTAAGVGNFIELAMDVNRPWMIPVILGVIGFVLLVLTVDLRRLKWILLALIPVSFSTVITFGMMCWIGVGFSILIITVMPLLLGLGVDDGLHVVHRMREDLSEHPAKATISVSRAIVMTTLTTCVSFGVLLFSNHPGMEAMAIALLFGLPLCLLSSATLIPAGAVLFFSEYKDIKSEGSGSGF